MRCQIVMKIKWSGLGMTDGSGKIGGNVAGKNRFGSYLRRKGQVLNPQTVAQQAVRMVFGALSQAWRDLTSAQRAAWRALTEFATVFDQFGDTIKLTGAQLYIKLNTNLALVGVAANDDAPVQAGAAQLGPPTVIMDIGAGATDALSIAMETAVNTSAQDSFLYVEATPPVSAGRTEGSIKNLFRGVNSGPTIVGVQIVANGSPIAYTDSDFTAPGIASNYVSLFGLPDEGQKVFWRFRAINQTTGESSPIIMAETTVIATP